MPGVGLNIAWQYLSLAQTSNFKSQARNILRHLQRLKSPHPRPSYVVPDANPVEHRGVQELEQQLVFHSQQDTDLCFMHNDFSLSNTIVDNDRIVALVDWEMAGYIGWDTAAKVHVQIRTPKRENFAALDLPEELLADILYWNNLYLTDH